MMTSVKNYRFLMNRDYSIGSGEISGAFHTDGRCVVPREREIDFTGGPENAIFIGEVQSGHFKIMEKYKQLPSIIVYADDLVLSPEAAEMFRSFNLGKEIGSLPVTLVEDGKPIADYVWFYSTEVLRAPCDLPETDLNLLGTIEWMVTDELREEIVNRGFTGVCFEQIGR